MSPSEPVLPLESFVTFGDLLKYARRRARLTQREVAIAVGYSEAQISRLEQNLRPPDLAALTALFIPALYLEEEPEMVARLMELAAQARGENLPQNVGITFSRSIRKEVLEDTQSIEDHTLNNLPLPLTSFIGRQREIAELRDLLGLGATPLPKNRLVSLLGSGGAGKTRLALEVARSAAQAFRDGVWFIELASISNPGYVPQAILSALGLPESHTETPYNAMLRYLRNKALLLILDNCEQIVAGVAQLVEEILRLSPTVQILATSREVLNIAGEVRFRVPSLSLPTGALPGRELLSGSEAVRLFAERAQSVFPPFLLNEDNFPAILQICCQLDGMPLAIELAAARIGLLSAEQIAVRLQKSFQFLGSGARTLPRHQTLEATIQWSYELLSEEEGALFAGLSVFSGGWTLSAAESVAGDSSRRSSETILDLLSQLVDKSLVSIEWQPRDEVRYRLLETIRQFAQEKLRARNEREQIRARHFDYFFRMAQQGEENLFAERSSLDWAETEIDNLRAALAWTLERDATSAHSEQRTGRGLELMTYIWPLWLSRGYISEGNTWMKQLLNAHTGATPARARALLLAGDFARYRGDFVEQATLIQELVALAQKLGDKKRIAWSLMELGLLERDYRHYLKAIPILRESLTMFQALNETLWVYRVSFLLAETYMANADLEFAKSLWENGLDLCRLENDKFHIAWGLEGLGNVERLEGRLEQSRQLYMESLKLKVSVMDKAGITYGFEAFAQLAAAQNQFKKAVVLWSAAAKMRQTLNLLLIPSREKIYASLLPAARAELGEEAFAVAWAEGKAMKMQEAIEYALTPFRDSSAR